MKPIDYSRSWITYVVIVIDVSLIILSVLYSREVFSELTFILSGGFFLLILATNGLSGLGEQCVNYFSNSALSGIFPDKITVYIKNFLRTYYPILILVLGLVVFLTGLFLLIS